MNVGFFQRHLFPTDRCCVSRIDNASHNGSQDQNYWELDTQLTYQASSKMYFQYQ